TLIQRIEALYQSLDADLKFQLKPEEEKEIEEGVQEKAAVTLDLRGVPCPINYVRAKIAIEGMEVGECIDILLDDGEPIRNVPASLENDGQEILEIRKENGHYLLRVMKKV
ncbi:MAG: sulfurtransferase TusA family protein, partial [Armatimonadota bacterium]